MAYRAVRWTSSTTLYLFGATSLQLIGLIALGLLLSMVTRRFIEVRRAVLAALFFDVFGACSCGA